jgi:hypothetical protein
LEERALGRDRLPAREEVLGADEDDGRVFETDGELEGFERVLLDGVDKLLPVERPEPTKVGDDGVPMTPPFADRLDLSGSIRLLPIFVVPLFLITMLRLPEYPIGIVDA